MTTDQRKFFARIGRRVELARLQRSLTVVRLAEMIGLDPGTINNIEKGKYGCQLWTMYLIAEGLKMKLSDLIGEGPISGVGK